MQRPDDRTTNSDIPVNPSMRSSAGVHGIADMPDEVRVRGVREAAEVAEAIEGVLAP
jgi:hypothetical protein